MKQAVPRRYRRSSRELALDHMVRAIRSATMASLSAERASHFEVSRQLEHVARQLVWCHEVIAEKLPQLRTQTYNERRP